MSAFESKIDQVFVALGDYRRAGKRIVVSSSFQTHSIPMLHMLQQLHPSLPIAFLDTGYHFPETIAFRDEITELLKLNLVVVNGHEQKGAHSAGLYVTSETVCCNVNKVEPMNELLEPYDVWISGVRKDQTANRQNFDSVMAGPSNTERYHPMLSWTDVDIETYRATYDLPAHPLEVDGYTSIGCGPCTGLPTGAGRSGRWSDTEKTECGLHLV